MSTPEEIRSKRDNRVLIWIIFTLFLLSLFLFFCVITAFTNESWSKLDTWVDAAAIYRNVGLILAALIGLWIAFDRAQTATRQADIANQNLAQVELGHETDRFQKAVEMLGSEKAVERIAALAILDDVTNPEENRYLRPVQLLMCEFIRQKSEPAEQAFNAYKSAYTSARNEALSLGRAFDNSQISETVMLNFTRTAQELDECQPAFELYTKLNARDHIAVSGDLRRARFNEISAVGKDLTNTRFGAARLININFSGAVLCNVNFTKADLEGCKFEGAVTMNTIVPFEFVDMFSDVQKDGIIFKNSSGDKVDRDGNLIANVPTEIEFEREPQDS